MDALGLFSLVQAERIPRPYLNRILKAVLAPTSFPIVSASGQSQSMYFRRVHIWNHSLLMSCYCPALYWTCSTAPVPVYVLVLSHGAPSPNHFFAHSTTQLSKAISHAQISVFLSIPSIINFSMRFRYPNTSRLNSTMFFMFRYVVYRNHPVNSPYLSCLISLSVKRKMVMLGCVLTRHTCL